MSAATDPRPLTLGPTVRRSLSGLRQRARLSLGVRGFSSLILILVLAALLSYGLDRTLRLGWSTRATLLVLALSGAAALVYTRLLRPLTTPLPDTELARVVERVEPSLDWRLMSAVQFASGWSPDPSTSTELAQRVVNDAERLAGEVDFGRAVPLSPVAKSGFRGAVVLVAAIALCNTFADDTKKWAQRNLLLSTSVQWPKDTRLEITNPENFGLKALDGKMPHPDDMSDERPTPVLAMPRGDDLVISVLAKGVVPSRVYVDVEGNADTGTLVMDAVGKGQFRTELLQLKESFTFTVRGGDDVIGPFEVQVLRRPWIEGLSFTVTPPPHTGSPQRTFGVEAGSVSLPEGTQVTLQARVSKPLTRAWLETRTAASSTAAIHTATLAGEGRDFSATFRLEQSGIYQVRVEDEHELGFEEPTRFSLVARPDEAPEVRLKLHGVGLNVTPQASLPLTVSAEDDYGLVGGEFRYRATGGTAEKPFLEQNALPLEELAGRRAGEAESVLELKGIELEPRMALTLWAQATDTDPSGPNVGTSPSHTLRVVTAEQLLNELLRRLHEQRLALERAITEEERLAMGLSGLDQETLGRAPRAHRDVARIVNRAAEVVEGTVAEMKVNKILDKSTWGRLLDDVATPLHNLHGGPLRRAQHLAETAGDAEGPERDALMSQGGAVCERVVRDLKRIVAHMDRIEELAELIALLKRIIKREQDLLDRTRQEERGR